jgi:hypothetical protein
MFQSCALPSAFIAIRPLDGVSLARQSGGGSPRRKGTPALTL